MVTERLAGTLEVLYALPDEQDGVVMPFEAGVTAMQYVERSGLLRKYPQIQESPLLLGVYGKAVPHEHIPRAGDRIEICRPLIRDPREMRQALWAEGKVIGGKEAGETSGKGD